MNWRAALNRFCNFLVKIKILPTGKRNTITYFISVTQGGIKKLQLSVPKIGAGIINPDWPCKQFREKPVNYQYLSFSLQKSVILKGF